MLGRFSVVSVAFQLCGTVIGDQPVRSSVSYQLLLLADERVVLAEVPGAAEQLAVRLALSDERLAARQLRGGVTGGAGVCASAEAGQRATKATRIGSARLAKRRRVAAFVDAVLRVIAIATVRPGHAPPSSP